VEEQGVNPRSLGGVELSPFQALGEWRREYPEGVQRRWRRVFGDSGILCPEGPGKDGLERNRGRERV
jgi:hypothetical protein